MISVLVPVYQNELNVERTFKELEKTLTSLQVSWEVVFVDDGSSDKSYFILSELQKKNINVSVVKLSRNFGQINALFAGLRYVKGSCVIIISADLQDPPELISQMVSQWQQGEKFIIAARESRVDKGINEFFANLFWKMVSRYALPGYPKGGFDFCLVDKKIVTLVNSFAEKNTHIFPLLYYYGFKPIILTYKRGKRELGASQWTLSKKIKLLLDTFIGFSFLPIRTISILGIFISILSIVFSFYTVLSYLLLGNDYTGWTTLVVIISFLGGVVLICLGIIAEYLWRILEQVRPRPSYVVEDVLLNSEDNNKFRNC
jgi:glycosyltransferase involved in cell wall biosynthesis